MGSFAGQSNGQSCRIKKKQTRWIIESASCGKRDLNPYGVNHTPLKRARLPVPPLPRLAEAIASTDDIIAHPMLFVKGGKRKKSREIRNKSDFP